MRTRPHIPLLLEVMCNASPSDSTRLGVAFGQISRYLLFVNLIVERYRMLSQRYIENSNALRLAFEQGANDDSFTSEQTATFDEAEDLYFEVHLEIETFYLFAKILLDKVAHFLQFYFEPARGLPLNSHDQLVRNFTRFCIAKGITPSSKFLEVAKALKVGISDHRDYRIAHEDSPRTMYGTMHDWTGRPRISMFRLNPTERDRQIESGPLEDLFVEADHYIRLAIEVVKTNQNEA